jgi:signal transduction histidine kinase/ligand-binding sensor domain-containing protein
MTYVSRLALAFAIATAVPAVSAAQDVGGILQDYALNSWTEKDGLPSSRITAIAQTADEYLWLGTNAGLVRFDGVKFLPWKELSDAPLPARRVWALCASRDGSLWVGFTTPGGISRIKDGTVTNFDETSGLTGGYIESLTEDRDGSIWAGTHGGLFHFRNGKWELVGPEGALPDGTVSSTFEDSRGNLWVSTTDGVFRRLKDKPLFEHIMPASYWAHRVMEDKNGAVWITDPRVGIRLLLKHVDSTAPATAAVTQVPEGHGLGVQMLPDSHGDMWIATLGRGVWRLRAQDGRSSIDTLTIDKGLLNNSVRALWEDHKGNIWVGTDNGLHQLSKKTLTGITRLGLVRVLERGADDSIWVGTTTGLVRFKDGRETRYSAPQLPSSFVTALHADREGTLWIVTDSGVTRFKNEHFLPIDVPYAQLTRVYSVTTDAHGSLWLCDSNHGLFRWANQTLTPFDMPGLDHRKVTSVGGDASGRVWIHNTGGSLTIVEADGSSHQAEWGNGSNSFYQDTTDAGGWLSGIDGAGRLDGNRLLTIGEKNGMPTAMVGAVIPGDDGHLWLATPVGIVRISDKAFQLVQKDPAAQVAYTLYGTEDGMAGLPTAPGSQAAVRAADGRIWFVTTNGITIADPRMITDDSTVPPVHIEGLVADARRLGVAAHMRLAPKTSTIEIDYSAVTFSSPTKVRYRYRLDGFDREWREVGMRREALYTNLPPGKYQFRVGAANNERGFNTDAAAIDFVLLPTFYQTWWFYGVSALTLVLALWLIWQMRVRHLQREFSLVLGERVRVSREIHDTLLQSLVGVALQLDALSEAAEPLGFMKDALARTRREVEDYIRETRQSIWKLRSPKLERGDLAAALRQTGERATSGTPVQFTLTTTGHAQEVKPDIEQQLLRIGEQAVLNSVRHANASQVHLKLHYSDDAVQLRVSDNGRGFDADDVAVDQGEHYGLVGMQERTHQAGGQLSITTHPGGGTAVEVVIPVTSGK